MPRGNSQGKVLKALIRYKYRFMNFQKCDHICIDEFDGYSCDCDAGYFLPNDKIFEKCQDINECDTGDYKCPENSYCANSIGSYDCQCSEGFEKDEDNCIDIDECQIRTSIYKCSALQYCVNTVGSYECHCDEGYSKIEDGCIDQNECESNPCGENEDCVNIPGSFTCSCSVGFKPGSL